jgi:hypothetical protein
VLDGNCCIVWAQQSSNCLTGCECDPPGSPPAALGATTGIPCVPEGTAGPNDQVGACCSELSSMWEWTGDNWAISSECGLPSPCVAVYPTGDGEYVGELRASGCECQAS